MVTLLFTVLYMIIPNTRVRLRPAFLGAIVAGVLWAAVGSIFTRFVEYSSRLTLVYAGFAAVIGVVMWTYFGWLILLCGAQLSFYIQNPGYLRFGLRELHLSAAELEQLALTITFLVAHNAATGRPRYSARRPRHRPGRHGPRARAADRTRWSRRGCCAPSRGRAAAGAGSGAPEHHRHHGSRAAICTAASR